MKKLWMIAVMALSSIHQAQGAPTVLTWHDAQVIEQLEPSIKGLFIPFFQNMYASLTEEDLYLTGKFATKADWLTKVAENLVHDLQDATKNLYVITAYQASEMVGFAVFNQTSTPNVMHLKQFALSAVAPDMQIAQQLIDAIFIKVPTTTSLVVGVRKKNVVGAALYKNLGFVPAAVPENHNPIIFDGLMRLRPAAACCPTS